MSAWPDSAWPDSLRLAVRLGLAPEAFWRLSLREWRALTAAPASPVLDRAALETLITRFPDQEPADERL